MAQNSLTNAGALMRKGKAYRSSPEAISNRARYPQRYLALGVAALESAHHWATICKHRNQYKEVLKITLERFQWKCRGAEPGIDKWLADNGKTWGQDGFLNAVLNLYYCPPERVEGKDGHHLRDHHPSRTAEGARWVQHYMERIA